MLIWLQDLILILWKSLQLYRPICYVMLIRSQSFIYMMFGSRLLRFDTLFVMCIAGKILWDLPSWCHWFSMLKIIQIIKIICEWLYVIVLSFTMNFLSCLTPTVLNCRKLSDSVSTGIKITTTNFTFQKAKSIVVFKKSS